MKDEAWKKQPPKDGKPSTKEIAGRKYQWCIHHMAWGDHSSKECRLGASRKATEGKDKENKPSKQDKALSYAATAATIAGGPGFATFLSEHSEDEE